MLQDMTLKN